MVERNRLETLNITMELGGAGWLCDCLEDILVLKGGYSFFRKYRRSSYVLTVEVRENKRGIVLTVRY